MLWWTWECIYLFEILISIFFFFWWLFIFEKQCAFGFGGRFLWFITYIQHPVLIQHLFIFERETERESGRGRERETESGAGSRLRAVSTEPDAGLELTSHEIMTWAEVGRSTNWATQALLCYHYFKLGKHIHALTGSKKTESHISMFTEYTGK